jgi:hypothetical protein
MGVSATGSTGWSMSTIKTVSALGGAVFAALFYLFGPALTPTLHAEAITSCNEHTGGDFRNFSLQWVIGARPHWNCWDTADPARPAVDLGWWAK